MRHRIPEGQQYLFGSEAPVLSPAPATVTRTASSSDVRDVVRDVVRRLERVAMMLHGGRTEVFQAFLEALDALAAGGDDAPEVQEQGQPQRELRAAAQAVADLAKHTFEDALGPIYMQFGHSKGGLGQFFTPWSIASMMARLQLPPDGALPASRPFRIADTSCGAGIMLLAAADALPADFLAAAGAEFTGIDIDPVCAEMTRLNLAIHGLGQWSRVICGDALQML